MPSIQRVRERLSGKPIAVLAVNVDEPEARVRQFLTKSQLPDGGARYRLVGDIDWNADMVVGIVTQLMNGG